MFRFVSLALFALVVATLQPSAARACAVCNCGDRTLTTLDASQPFASRLRIGAGAMYRTDRLGESGVDAIRLREFRFDVAAAWAPFDRLMFLATMPFFQRSIEYVNLAKDHYFSPGDLDLRARFVVLRDQPIAATHIIALLAGAKLPTAPRLDSSVMNRLPLEAQPGTGSWDPLVGATYNFFADPFSLFQSATVTFPTRGWDSMRAATSLLTTTILQVQPWDTLGFRGSITTRFSGRTHEKIGTDPNSGGFIVFVGPGAVWSPTMDLVVYGTVNLPAVQNLYGEHHEGPVYTIGMTYDL